MNIFSPSLGSSFSEERKRKPFPPLTPLDTKVTITVNCIFHSERAFHTENSNTRKLHVGKRDSETGKEEKILIEGRFEEKEIKLQISTAKIKFELLGRKEKKSESSLRFSHPDVEKLLRDSPSRTIISGRNGKVSSCDAKRLRLTYHWVDVSSHANPAIKRSDKSSSDDNWRSQACAILNGAFKVDDKRLGGNILRNANLIGIC